LVDIVDVDGTRDDGRSKDEAEKGEGDCGASSTTTTTTTATFVFGFILITSTSTTATTPTHLVKKNLLRNLEELAKNFTWLIGELGN